VTKGGREKSEKRKMKPLYDDGKMRRRVEFEKEKKRNLAKTPTKTVMLIKLRPLRKRKETVFLFCF